MKRSDCHTSQSSNKEQDEQISKKNKEIYDLTVQLGCLKEENLQLKKDKDEMTLDFSERLRAQ